MTVRQALQQSLNVPAIAVLDEVGASRLTARIAQAGATLVLPDGEAPGLAIGLGGVGIKLSDLVMLYAGHCPLGTTLPLQRAFRTRRRRRRARLMEPVAAWYVGNVLLGSPPPENGVAGRIAFKTGTSYGYRDAWSVGFDGKHTIGVWVGRADGAPVPGLVGRRRRRRSCSTRSRALGTPPAALPRAPKGVLVTSSAKLPPPLRRFQPGRLAGATSQAVAAHSVPARRRPARSVDDRRQAEPVPLKITGAVAPLTVLVNGVPVPAQRGRRCSFEPDGPGFSRVTVMDAAGATHSVVGPQSTTAPLGRR